MAYKELLLRPLPGGTLTWARATQETARGRVTCGWSLDGDQITVTATVPPGTTAILAVPTADQDSVRPANRSGVLEAMGATLWLTSGHHVVTASYWREKPGEPHRSS